MRTKPGTCWGQVAVALVVVLGLGSNAAAAVRPTRAVQGSPNYVGSSAMVLASVQFDGEPWLELRMSSGANLPNPGTSFGSDAVVLGHAYFRLTPGEAQAFADAIGAWLDQPHSLVVYDVFGDQIGFSVTGSAFDPAMSPIIVVSIMHWLQSGRGHLHGGNYISLTVQQAESLRAALETWATTPEAGAKGLLFQMAAY